MAVYALAERTPQIAPSAWIAESAEVIGSVVVGEEASFWYGSVARGDTEQITVGARSNVQEHAVLHADPGFPLVIGDNVTVGHQAMLHGCTIGEGSLIGIQAVVLNGARIGKNCLVAAGAVVTEGKVFEDGMLIVGAPAKALRPLTEEALTHLRFGAAHYARNAALHRAELRRIA